MNNILKIRDGGELGTVHELDVDSIIGIKVKGISGDAEIRIHGKTPVTINLKNSQLYLDGHYINIAEAQNILKSLGFTRLGSEHNQHLHINPTHVTKIASGAKTPSTLVFIDGGYSFMLNDATPDRVEEQLVAAASSRTGRAKS